MHGQYFLAKVMHLTAWLGKLVGTHGVEGREITLSVIARLGSMWIRKTASCELVGIEYYREISVEFFMMTAWHGNSFFIIDSLWRESTGYWWSPSQRAGNYVFFAVSYSNLLNKHSWSAPVIWETMMLRWRYSIDITIDLFHNNLSLADSSPNSLS